MGAPAGAPAATGDRGGHRGVMGGGGSAGVTHGGLLSCWVGVPVVDDHRRAAECGVLPAFFINDARAVDGGSGGGGGTSDGGGGWARWGGEGGA